MPCLVIAPRLYACGYSKLNYTSIEVSAQYLSWLGALLSGHPGHSLAADESVWDLTYPRLINSAVLVAIVGVISSVLGIGLGTLAALRRDRAFDTSFSALSLAATALPEFVVALALIICFSTVVLHVLPGVSILPPGTYAWTQPRLLILPAATLVLVTVPYIYRMMRAAMIEALESEYVGWRDLRA